jgi:hypothetical protein
MLVSTSAPRPTTQHKALARTLRLPRARLPETGPQVRENPRFQLHWLQLALLGAAPARAALVDQT